jgi:hypothetical protein
MKSTKWTIFIRLIFCILGFIFGFVLIFAFSGSSNFTTGILIIILTAILIAIHVPLLIKYYRLAKVCKAYEGTFVEFASPAIGFACVRVKFTVNGEEKTMDSLRVYHADRRPLVSKNEILFVGYSPLYDYVIIL